MCFKTYTLGVFLLCFICVLHVVYVCALCVSGFVRVFYVCAFLIHVCAFSIHVCALRVLCARLMCFVCLFLFCKRAL